MPGPENTAAGAAPAENGAEGENAPAAGEAEGAEKAPKPGKTQMYKVTCLNCTVQLHIELPPNCSSFQCCQCHAVHKIIAPDPSLASDENRKRKRRERNQTKDKEPREMTPYNKFMKNTLAELKVSNPDLDHKEAFKMASAKWTAQKNTNTEAGTEGGGEVAEDVAGSSKDTEAAQA